MYEDYTRQALPEKYYRELLGTAICVFNSNNAFVIENLLREQLTDKTWYELIDYESGKIKEIVKNKIKDINPEIFTSFEKLVSMRNRIIHSFQITAQDGKQMLATKEKIQDGNKQFIITEEYLMEFIKENEKLCLLLDEFRGY